MIARPFLLLFFLFVNFQLLAQLKGVVTDTGGEPLAFATVYVQGTTTGTTTNLDGEYFLELKNGNYQLVFQYIGYKQKIESVQLEGKPVRLNVSLAPEAIELGEVVVRANVEDPAYAIIRKAIEKREYYLRHVQEYSCDVYVKGNIKLLSAPEKILGQEVGDIEGSLDSNRQGIVYLSESVSKLYFRQPDRYKEVMISSKVSGNNQGFSFNSAREMDIDFYKNFISFGRNLISPIADGALGYYRYRLEGTLTDEENRLIHKISVIPKNQQDPVYQGFIYIVDGLWNIQSTDLFLRGVNIQQPLFDTFFVRQTHVPVAKPDVWRLFSQTFTVSGGLFGFKFGGSFTGIYTGYNLQPQLEEDFFGNQLMKVEPGANEKDTAYWNETRPVPLTTEEVKDYVKKDSIQVIRESKTYLDSIDRKNNKLKFGKLIFGYTYTNSWKRRTYTVESPINTIQFNTVQGFNVHLGLSYSKAFDKERNRRLSVKTKVNYGFSEEKFRASGELNYHFDPKHFARIMLSGGREVAQFFEANPISPLINTSYSLFGRKNYIRLFDKTFVRGEFRREIANGLLFFAIGQWARRAPLVNHSDYSFFKREEREYEPNIPENDRIGDGDLSESEAVSVGLSFRIRLKQKYLDYPDAKYIMGSKFPDIWIHYRGGLPLGNATADYGRISAVLSKSDITLGLGGVSSFRFEAGKFLYDNQLYFQDFKHFLGNETRIGNPEQYMSGFKRLPYYAYSTRNAWAEGHWEHNFKGFLTDKLPLVKKLGWSLVAGAAVLYTPEEKDYAELSLGLDNIGFGVARLFRFDVVSSFRNGKYDGTGWLMGIRLPTGEISL